MIKKGISQNSDLNKSLKATSLFGGVQVFSIVVSIIRNKLIALLIGPVGVGVVEMYNSTINLIKSFTDFSLQVSAVRDVSIAYKSNDYHQFSRTVCIFSKIVWGTGLLGTIVCLVGSPFWSKMTFGNYNYTLGFALISIVLLLNQLERGKIVILQGTEHYRYMAYSGIIGNLLGLVTTIPIYYIWGLDGIVPVLILTAAIAYFLSFYYANKIEVQKCSLSNVEAVNASRNMLKQGYLLSINYLYSALIFYIIRVFITDRGGVAEIGLYSASFAVVNSYVGLVFQSMGQEYYPRLSGLSSDNIKFNDAINNQIYLSLLILGPLVAVFLTFSDQILILLYSDKFTGASLLMAVSMLGIIYQAPSWCMAYSILAKGDNKDFLKYESIAKSPRLFLDILFYLIWGLTGLGISFLLSYLYYTVQCSYVCRKKYGLVINNDIIRIIIIYSIIGLFSIAIFAMCPIEVRFFIGSIVVIISVVFSYVRISKIVNIKQFIINKLGRK